MIFFLLVFALSLPFWLLGSLVSAQLLPALPVSALGFICPVGAAAIMLRREQGGSAVLDLLKRSFDADRVTRKIWYVPAVLLMPVIMALSFLVMRLAKTAVPFPRLSLVHAAGLFVLFFIAALGEELGWSGYALEPLQKKSGPLLVGIVIGLVWAVLHYVPLAQAHRALSFIAWWTLGTVAARVIIVWLYNGAGKSVFVTALFHAMINVSWQLFPVNGSFYDPRITGPITAVAAAVIAGIWSVNRHVRRARGIQGKVLS